LAFVATYGIVTFTIFSQSGAPIVPVVLPNITAIIAAAITIFARLSLGRSIGYVPANRGIVTRGAYRFVRHPVYTGMFLALVSVILRSYTPLNLAAAATIFILFVVKSMVEERFLSEDAEYAEYMQKVRWRWLPGIA
jgi:protein-S-isoprenylcysteine O-methyltransferase Ste14